MKDKWDQFITVVWNDILAHWRLIQNYRNKQPVGTFFQMTFNAVQNNLMIKLADVVKFCEHVAEVVEPGQEGRERLKELKEMCEKGRPKDNANVNLGDVGVGTYRDKVAAHHLNRIKLLLDKPEYTLTFTWNTVEQTINKLREFCIAVQNHHIAEWNCEWSTDDMEAVDDVFDSVLIGLVDGSKYNQLRFEVLKRGNPRIEYDVNNRELRLLDD